MFLIKKLLALCGGILLLVFNFNYNAGAFDSSAEIIDEEDVLVRTFGSEPELSEVESSLHNSKLGFDNKELGTDNEDWSNSSNRDEELFGERKNISTSNSSSKTLFSNEYLEKLRKDWLPATTNYIEKSKLKDFDNKTMHGSAMKGNYLVQNKKQKKEDLDKVEKILLDSLAVKKTTSRNNALRNNALRN